MGQYKVPQNVEAEDKILGPLTLKQFIYAIIAVGVAVVTYLIGKYLPFVYIAGVPPALLFALLATPRGDKQPFEALFLALVSFTVKPRKRVWLKDPIAEVFMIEAPKPVEEAPAVDSRQVHGQLEKLSQIIDTRGWAAKQPDIQEPDSTYFDNLTTDDRLASVEYVTVGDINSDISVADDILDFKNNPSAQNLDQLIEDSVANVRLEAMQKMREQANHPAPTTGGGAMTPQASNAILRQAMSSSELTVSQVAAQAQRYGRLEEGQKVEIYNGSN